MRITDFMTPEPTTVSPVSTAGDAIRVMVLKGFRHLPVLDGERRLVGMVSERDLRGVDQHVLVQTAMSSTPVTADDSQDLSHATALLAREGVGGLPVVKAGTTDVLVGIVTSVDVLAAHRDATPLMNVAQVLVPIDLEQAAFDAIVQAQGLFRHASPTITALYVAQAPSNASPASLLGSASPESRRQAAEEEVASVLASAGIQGVELKIAIGDPAERIIEVAAELDADMVVIPPHSRGAVERFFTGSVTEKVVRTAPCPVWVLRGDLLRRLTDRSKPDFER